MAIYNIDDKDFEFDDYAVLEKLADSYGERFQYIAAISGNRLIDLQSKAPKDQNIHFIDAKTSQGSLIFAHSISLVLAKAVHDIFPDNELEILHSLSGGYYCELCGKEDFTSGDMEKIEAHMREMISMDIPIEKNIISRQEAREVYTRQNRTDKVALLEASSSKLLTAYSLDGMIDYFFSFMAPSTGYLKDFALLYHSPGMVLQFPRPWLEYTQQQQCPKLAAAHKECEKWGRILDCVYISDINRKIKDGSMDDLIRVNEGLHEKKISQIADDICSDDKHRVIFISGPSSSGKTTFAHRLMIQLKVNGKKPVSISLDDYYKGVANTPLDENGEPDFEALEALDYHLFNQNMNGLLDSGEAELPLFDFKQQKRSEKTKPMKILTDQPIIVEGIHALNPKLSAQLDDTYKYKIYISALTQLNMDMHNRISTSDYRLIRRIIRDSRTRGASPDRTLSMWSSVRKGEMQHIFPFQENADVMFNSSLLYELSLLRNHVELLLQSVDRSSERFDEAQRLLEIISYIMPYEETNDIPKTSILREFIGGGSFDI